MNILLISYDYPPMKGGIANVSCEMAHQLSSMGENVIVVAEKTKGDKEFDRGKKFLTYRGINVFLLRELVLLALLPYLAIKHKIDILYILIWCQGGAAGFITSKLLNIPYILHAHGAEFIDYKKTLFDKIKYGLFRERYKRLIFKNAKRIIAVSDYTKEIVIESGASRDRVDVINCGVDIDRFRPGLDANVIISRYRLEDKKVLLTVSRLEKYKGHEIVIDIMPPLLKKIPNLIYLIVGSGTERCFLESLVKQKNLRNNVIFVGYVDNLELPLYYNACDIYIMLTRDIRSKGGVFEGFGLVYLEANSCSKAVIGARTGGIPDAIVDGKTGYLVDPDNSGEIMDKITLLLGNKELTDKMGEEGRARIIRQGLTWEAVGKRVQNILLSEVKGKKIC